MLKDNVFELDPAQTRQANRTLRPRLLRCIQNVLKVLQRDFCLSIDVNDVADFLQRSEDKEGINPQREKLAHGDLTRKNQIQHETQNRHAHRINRCSLDKAEAAQILHFIQLEIEDLAGRAVQTFDFLLGKPETLHQFDVSQGLCSRTCKGCRFGDNHLLNFFDFAAEDGNQCAEDGYREEIYGGNKPVHSQRIDHDKHNTYQRNE